VGVTALRLVNLRKQRYWSNFPANVCIAGEFQSFFGGLNALKSKKIHSAPQYELPYIAKSYLSQANPIVA
jgi:hypothetical protein